MDVNACEACHKLRDQWLSLKKKTGSIYVKLGHCVDLTCLNRHAKCGVYCMPIYYIFGMLE